MVIAEAAWIDLARTAAGRTPPTYSDPVIGAATITIRVAHIVELRAAVAALE